MWFRLKYVTRLPLFYFQIISKDLSFQNTTLEKADRKETNELKRKNVDVNSTALLKKVKGTY